VNPAHELLLAHLTKMHGRVEALHERARAAEKRSAWLEASRNKWRTKAIASSIEARELRQKVRDLERSRDSWKTKALYRARRVREERMKWELWKFRALYDDGGRKTSVLR
jgi:hypothetical protein